MRNMVTKINTRELRSKYGVEKNKITKDMVEYVVKIKGVLYKKILYIKIVSQILKSCVKIIMFLKLLGMSYKKVNFVLNVLEI